MEDELIENASHATQQQPQQTAEQQARQTIEDTLSQQREKWTTEITELNELMKSMPKVDELLNTVYTKRQSLVDYYYAMNGVILKHSKEYKALYNAMFNNIKINGWNGIRFTSDQQITRQIEVELQDRKEVIDLLANQNNFIKDTIQTVDNIIYGINQKIKIHALLNGISTI